MIATLVSNLSWLIMTQQHDKTTKEFSIQLSKTSFEWYESNSGVEYRFNYDKATKSLCNDINGTNGYGKCLPRRNKREILSYLPAKVNGLQIHNKLVAQDYFTTHEISTITLECTITFDYGVQ